MASVERRRGKRIGACVALLVVLVVAVIAVVRLIPRDTPAIESPKCELVNLNEFNFKPGTAKSVASRDGTALVTFEAFLEYERLNEVNWQVFVPLRLVSIEVRTDDKTNPDRRRLVLNSDCAQFEINLDYIPDSRLSSIKLIDMSAHFKKPNRDLRSCFVSDMSTKTQHFRYPSGKDHWELTLECKSNELKEGSAAASVLIKVRTLEIELDRAPASSSIAWANYRSQPTLISTDEAASG